MPKVKETNAALYDYLFNNKEAKVRISIKNSNENVRSNDVKRQSVGKSTYEEKLAMLM